MAEQSHTGAVPYRTGPTIVAPMLWVRLPVWRKKHLVWLMIDPGSLGPV